MNSYNFESIEKKRKKALSEQDSLKYSRLCDKLGLNFEDIEDEILYNLGKEKREFNKEVGMMIAKKTIKEKALKKTAESLKNAFKMGGSPYENTRWMRECYNENGINVLEINGKKIPLSKIDDAVLATYSIRLMNDYF